MRVPGRALRAGALRGLRAMTDPCLRRIYTYDDGTRRAEVWQRERGGHRIVILRQRPVTALRGRFAWCEEAAEEHGPDEGAAILRACELLRRAVLPRLRLVR